ncbi:hypothetical protein SAMD00019534_010980 [Acytostelium subglobosum LB1]|uniref:hypothetical protein n=1 Tax=Acytostelium subglobosum LB1 TaxID=1410327 RepID=UPI000644E842|nr:hypothetical protein SAMD00019534_010980 [Acytostelium subglobosum LB1]GAM17923.1 hypothetical protein SAMD00019534_010980 [Acytostelium subglobosum LB1]|eukprot:XP_012758519.1 hypothetical protein SAMD00019534_010980 [Acytostelium subglobosum LB1]
MIGSPPTASPRKRSGTRSGSKGEDPMKNWWLCLPVDYLITAGSIGWTDMHSLEVLEELSNYQPGPNAVLPDLTPAKIHRIVQTYQSKLTLETVTLLLATLEHHFVSTTSPGRTEFFNKFKDIPLDLTMTLHMCIQNLSKGLKFEQLVDILLVEDRRTYAAYDTLSSPGHHHSLKVTMESPEQYPMHKEFIKYYYDFILHFYLFSMLVGEFRVIIKQRVLAKTSQRAERLERLAKQLAAKADLLVRQTNDQYFLRLYDQDAGQVLEINRDGATLYVGKQKPWSRAHGKYLIRNLVHGDSGTKSNHLHLVSTDNFSAIVKVAAIPIDEIIDLHQSYLSHLGTTNEPCHYCHLPSYPPYRCSSCKVNICYLCLRRSECLPCYITKLPMTVIVHFKDEQKFLTVEKPDLREFATLVYKTFGINKGMSIAMRLVHSSKQEIPLDNDINLALALGEGNTCKMVLVTIPDPVIIAPIIPIALVDQGDSIGEGGYANVYRATVPKRPEFAGKDMVLKLLKLHNGALSRSDRLGMDAETKLVTLYKFRREASLLSHIQSVHVIGLHAFCQDLDNDQYGLLLERAPLGTISPDNKYPWELLLLMLLDICKALVAVHNLGYIHQDLKPSNILLFNECVDTPFRCKVTDYGISTTRNKQHNWGHTGQSHTPHYCAPEHDKYGEYDERVDIYTYGALMYELITSYQYSDHFSKASFEFSKIKQPDAKLLCQLLLKEDPELRPKKMEEVQEKLEGLLQKCRDNPSAWPAR